MAANRNQIGGDHYKGAPVEHWDFVLMHKMPYLEAQIFKYVLRWRKKNGIEDLRKARHYLDKLIEWEVQEQVEKDPRRTEKFQVGSGTVVLEGDDLTKARQILSGTDEEINAYMSGDSGVPRSNGYVNQD